MRFTDIFIKRPVFASCISLLLLVAGVVSFEKLTVRLFPNVDIGSVSITTTDNGANASLIENFVTTPIEHAISGVDGVDYITSTSVAGTSDITINFNPGTDIDAAVTEINTDLQGVKKTLPPNVDDPILKKEDSNSIPDLILTFSSTHMNEEQISDYLNRVVDPQLANVTGVGSAEVMGNRTYAMRIWLNPMKMSQYSISMRDIETALNKNNVQSNAGEIDRNQQAITINAQTGLTTSDQFGNIMVKSSSTGGVVRLRNVAKIKLGALDTTSAIIANGKPAVGIMIISKSSANPLDVVKGIKKTLASLEKRMPAGMHVSIPRDDSIYIQKSIDEVNKSILLATIFVIFVIFIFIGSIRSTLIPVITIPLSMFGTFALMMMLGYTINTLTLLAFVLAIGMVVDDAIVVLENIYRHIEAGETPFKAALIGAREIRFAVIAMTITLAAVYAPIGFSSGFTGTLFREFAFTLAGAVIISGFLALTLTPMMCSKLMKPAMMEGRIASKIEKIFNNISEKYSTLLRHVIKVKSLVLIALGATIVCGAIIFIPLYLTSTLAPTEDQGAVMGMLSAPSASNVEYTEKYSSQLEKFYNQLTAADGYVIANGVPSGENSAMTVIKLKDWSDRKQSSDDIIKTLTKDASTITGLSAMFVNPPSLPGSKQVYPFQFVIQTTGSYEQLNATVQKFINTISENKNILYAKSDSTIDKPELSIKINYNLAAHLGVSMDDISNALSTSYGQPQNNTFVMNGYTYYAVPQVAAQYRNNPNSINNINVKTASGKTIALSSLVNISNIVAPSTLNHFQGQRSATINVVLSPSYSTSEAIRYLETVASKDLPSDMSYDFSGTTRTFLQSGNAMEGMFVLALIFIYLVLSAQFESFVDPLIVLFTVPLSIVGALITLFFTHGSLNIYTEIGLITLIGLISKHGILIVEFANQLQARGFSRVEAAIEAAKQRFRPILMTTVAMLLGAFPLVIAAGAGAAARSQLGWVIFGGMLFGTTLTLFVVPTMYSLLGKKKFRPFRA